MDYFHNHWANASAGQMTEVSPQRNQRGNNAEGIGTSVRGMMKVRPGGLGTCSG